jgi:CheY-like chemotaxis protein
MGKIENAWVIDDDHVFTYVVSRQMKGIDFCQNLLTYPNGLEALNALKSLGGSPELAPDVILLDLNMPVMDGWQFLDEFRKLESAKSITIYIVSSSINVEDQVRASSYQEVSHFYVKPLKKDDLFEIIGAFS